jgi:hypothetical protein
MSEKKGIVDIMKEIVEFVKSKVDMEMNKLFNWNKFSSVQDLIEGELAEDEDGSYGILYELQCKGIEEKPLVVLKIMKDESVHCPPNADEFRQESEGMMSSRAFREDKLEKLLLVSYATWRSNEAAFRNKLSSYTVAIHDAISYKWNNALTSEYYESEVHLKKYPEFVVKLYELKSMGEKTENFNPSSYGNSRVSSLPKPMVESIRETLVFIMSQLGGGFQSLTNLFRSGSAEDHQAMKESIEVKFRRSEIHTDGTVFIKFSMLDAASESTNQAMKYDPDTLIEEIQKLMKEDEEGLKKMIGEFKMVEKDEEIWATFLMDSSFNENSKSSELFN